MQNSNTTKRRRRSDRGVTLTELLVVLTVAGVVLASVATATSAMIRSTPEAESRLAESKDVTFLQAWIPVDLSTSINSYTTPDDTALFDSLTNNDPNLVYSASMRDSLPGTNVLTLVVPNSETGQLEIIAYRYHLDGNDWQLSRFRIIDPGGPNEELTVVGVAHEIPEPPAGWTEGDPVDHAFELTARNQATLRPVGEDVKVIFESGNEFRTGGAGLSAEQDLTPNDPVTLPDPTAPPTRCGGRTAIVLDTSWSVPYFGGGADLESAATGLIDAFTGTPTDVTIFGFDAVAYSLYPNLNGDPGTYFSLLDNTVDSDGNTTTDIDEAKANIEALPNVDTWSTDYWVPTGSGYTSTSSRNAIVGWTQDRWTEGGTEITDGGTNWEDALHAPFFSEDGTQRLEVPELVVWITDGQPNRQRLDNMSYGHGGTDVEAAQSAANAGRSTGARIVGVLVGSPDSSLESNLASVVGGNVWTGTGPDDLGNAVAADYFKGSFSQLGDVLRSIMAAQCGGTVTIRKQLDDGSNPGGRWNYSTETGDQVLDLAVDRSITFDFTFATGEVQRAVTIREETVDGYSFLTADCELNGSPIDASKIVQLPATPDQIPGVEITLQPDEAVSCVMVSEPE